MARESVDTLPLPSRAVSADRWHGEVLLPAMTSRLAEHWDVVDSLPRAVALGLVPPPKVPTQVAPPKSP